MARKRMIDPEFFLDDELAQLSPHARLLYIGLWGICDDNYATFPNRPEWIKAQVFPYESVNTPQLLTELSATGKIILFSHEGKEFYWLRNFFKYQRVEKPSKPKYPEFSEANVIDSRGGVGEELGSTPAEVKLSKEKRREVKIKEEKSLSVTKVTSVVSYSSTDDLTEKDFEEVAEHYKVPLAYVKSIYEDMVIWSKERPNNPKLKGRNWRMTLMNWVKRGAIEIHNKQKGDPTKRSIDARDI